MVFMEMWVWSLDGFRLFSGGYVDVFYKSINVTFCLSALKTSILILLCFTVKLLIDPRMVFNYVWGGYHRFHESDMRK